jgi:eukaryotic-like serine/threonine-protein kinase
VGREQSERFVREGALLAEISHPSIVSYVGHGTTAEGLPYLAMEWLEGEDLAERLARQPLTLRESLTVLGGALRGLQLAHRRGIVHRDLKPSNLFLRGRHIDDVVLLDLGIARYVGGDTSLTRHGTILGTPSYMAPEQAQGQLAVGPAVDVFSLGCVLFECLTGDPPFVGAHVLTVLAKVLFEEAPRLRDVRPEIPETVAALVDHMLAKDPARRLSDAIALVAALEQLGAVAEVDAPRAGRAASARTSSSEQELVSVILATPVAGGLADEETETPAPPSGLDPLFPDVAPYGAILKRLV